MPLIPLLKTLSLCSSEMPSMLYPENLDGEINLQLSFSREWGKMERLLGGSSLLLIAGIMVH